MAELAPQLAASAPRLLSEPKPWPRARCVERSTSARTEMIATPALEVLPTAPSQQRAVLHRRASEPSSKRRLRNSYDSKRPPAKLIGLMRRGAASSNRAILGPLNATATPLTLTPLTAAVVATKTTVAPPPLPSVTPQACATTQPAKSFFSRTLQARKPSLQSSKPPPPTTRASVDVDTERRTTMNRIAEHRKRLDMNAKLKDSADDERRARYANVDLEEIRRVAGQRVSETRILASQRAEAIATALVEKRRDQSAKRLEEARRKERRRAEIYALNQILRRYYRSLGLID